MSVQRIAGRYAKSLVELSQEQNKLDRVLQDMNTMKMASQNKDLALLLKSPIVNATKKQSVMDALFSKSFDEMTMAFVKLLINKGREPYLPAIADAFIAQYKKINHISTVKVITAKPLTEAGLNDLRKKLEASEVTEKSVEIETEVDENLIGGFVLEIGDKIYDASVAQKLEELKRSFQN
ncbi:MAG: ATP synthase F1 subunit delta [Bacteroidota bacterium]